MDKNKVLATINGKEIKDQDVYAFLNQLGPQTAAQFNSPEGIKKVADELVNQELLYLEAIEKGLDKEEEFQNQLEQVKRNILKQYAINKLLGDVTVSQDEVVQFYNDKKEFFKTDESVRASHILVDDEEEANKIFQEIENGLSFEDAAKKYSNCPSKDKGGDLGEFTKGKMVPEFETAAFSMEEGKVSEPVKTQFGYHLIKVDYKKAPGISPLEEVEKQIFQQLLGMKQQEKYLNKTKELKDKNEVNIYY